MLEAFAAAAARAPQVWAATHFFLADTVFDAARYGGASLAEVIGAAGYPGSVDSYQVNFRVPPDTARGPATIQVTAAWISGAPVSIPVQ